MSEKIILEKDELRKFQMNLLEMIVEVDRVCRKNNIEYSLDGGTLLGAMRHKGFIPWDDDADVIFTREEYNKFKKACEKDLDTERFFLQDYKTDKDYRWGYAKIRRNGTEFVRIGQENMHYKTGICIDVFVVDKVSDNKIVRAMDYFFIYCSRKILYSELGREAAPTKALRLWYRMLHIIPKSFAFWIRDSIARRNNKKDKTELISHYLYPYVKKCKYGLPADSFNEYTDTEYEGLTLRRISGAHNYLTTFYGDYMTPPPLDQQHGPGEASKIEMLDLSLEDVTRIYKKGISEIKSEEN